MALYGGDFIASMTGGFLKSSIYLLPSGEAVESNLGGRMFLKAEELINRYGTTAVIYNATKEYDSVEGKQTVLEDVSQTKKIIPPYPFSKALVDGDMIRMEDMQTGVAAKNLIVPITEGLQLTVMGSVYTLERYWPIIGNDTLVMYLMQLRR